MTKWAGVDAGLAAEVIDQSERCLATYREDASRVEQDAAIESSTAQGGYGRKQLRADPERSGCARQPGRIHVVLTREPLYVANEGNPMAPAGVPFGDGVTPLAQARRRARSIRSRFQVRRGHLGQAADPQPNWIVRIRSRARPITHRPVVPERPATRCSEPQNRSMPSGSHEKMPS